MGKKNRSKRHNDNTEKSKAKPSNDETQKKAETTMKGKARLVIELDAITANLKRKITASITVDELGILLFLSNQNQFFHF